MTTTESAGRLLWADFETTGLDHPTLGILEVAFVLTDEDLTELGYFQQVLPARAETLEGMDEIVRTMHQATGLWDECLALSEAGVQQGLAAEAAVDAAVCAWLNDAGVVPGAEVRMAGSGVGPFDRPLARMRFPELERRLHYRVIDTSPVTGFLQLAGANSLLAELAAVDEQNSMAHRALEDTRCAIAKAKVMIDAMRRNL